MNKEANKEAYLHMQRSESIVASMAATIFAAYVQRHEITEANEDVFVRKAVDAAVKLATYTDKVVKSDEEWMNNESRAAPML